MTRLALACILVALVVAGCGRSPTSGFTTAPPSSPTADLKPPPTYVLTTPAAPASTPLPSPTLPPIPATVTTTFSQPATVSALEVDTRFGAVFFSTRLNVTDLPCAALQKMGIHSTFFGAWWGAIEPQPGRYDWSTVDGPVEAALACDVEPVIKISTASGPGKAGTPPPDMAAYARYVFDLAQHLKGRVHAYAIENEINNPRMVWTAETYGPLRAAAYQAIKRADPNAQVLDGGLTMQAYLVTKADELVQAGQAQEAVAMLARFETTMRRQEKDLPDNEQQLAAWLSSPTAQRSLSLMEEMRAHPETYDAVQLHYLQDAWELIPEYVSWTRSWFPGKPFEFWELGFGWEGDEFTEEAHARGVIKTLILSLGEGARRVIYEPYWETAQANAKSGRGLVTPAGPRLAATAYGTMASQLSAYEEAERLDLGAGVWAYRFTTPRGDVYVVWAGQDITVHLPLSAPQVTVVDIAGGTTQADPAALPVGVSPVFVTLP